MRRLYALLLAVLALAAAGCTQTGGDVSDTGTVSTAAATYPEQTAAPTEPEEVYGFRVEGTKLLDANGNEFIMRGVNHAHNWYPIQDLVSLTAIAEAGCNTVRIVCGSGYKYHKDSAATLSALIQKCKELKMIAVLEVHDITGSNDISALEQVVDYWIEVKDALIGNEAYAILNIANEWVGSRSSATWHEGYRAAIPRLREAGIKNTILVDAAGWGQYGTSIADYGAEVLNADPERNTMFAVHMYGTAGKNPQTIESNITGATDQELCIIVGEFGHTHSDGDVDEGYILQYCDANDIGYLGWSWKGNGGGVGYLDIAVTWDGSVLSEDWGEILIGSEYGIKATSEICSVFE